MVMPRVSLALGRLLTRRSLNQEAKRTIYPFNLRYLAVRHPSQKAPSPTEQIVTFLAFVVGIMGPPTYIMYDVGKKRPKTLE